MPRAPHRSKREVEVEEEEGKEMKDNNEDGEVRNPRIGRRPVLPTQADIADIFRRA